MGTEWYTHEKTQALRTEINEKINELKNRWASGEFTGASFDETCQLNAKHIGFLMALEEVLDYIVEIDHNA